MVAATSYKEQSANSVYLATWAEGAEGRRHVRVRTVLLQTDGAYGRGVCLPVCRPWWSCTCLQSRMCKFANFGGGRLKFVLPQLGYDSTMAKCKHTRRKDCAFQTHDEFIVYQ